jgi:hypothetical protein
MDGSGAGQYLKGDVVDTKAPGAPIGNLEGLPHFIWVTVTDAEREDTALLVAPVMDVNGDMLARRNVRMRVTDVDNVINDAVRPGRLITNRTAFEGMLEPRTVVTPDPPGGRSFVSNVVNNLMFWR